MLDDVELEAVRAVLARERTAADEQVQALARNGLVERLLALLTTEVRQQIVDDELRVALVRADVDGDHVPSPRTTTPCSSSGMVTQWYLRMPP